MMSPRVRGGRPYKKMTLGQSLVEFAMVLPIMLVLLFATIDFGYYMFVLISVNHAGRQGVRKAAMNIYTRDQIRNTIIGAATGVNLSADCIQITTAKSDLELPGHPPSVTIKVQSTHRFFATHLLGVETLPVRSVFRSMVVTYAAISDISY